jgi:putative heme-binding domain-containing protein
LGTFLDELPEAIAGRTAEALAGFADLAEDADADPTARRDAIRLLADAPWDVSDGALSRLLVDEPDQGLRIAAAQALAARAEPEVADRLLGPWRSLTPAVRREVAQGMVARPDRAGALLDAMEQGILAPRDLDANQSRRLRDHPTPEVRDRARSLLASSLPAERAAVLERYREAIEMSADPHRGREVFRKLCTTCHRLEDQGVEVGPDIGDTRTRTKAALLTDILNPNEAIDANYVSYTVATVDGQVLGGLIASETASALTLMRAEGQTDTILKQEIDEIQSDGVSLMPEGVEQDLTVQEMADLLDYLKNWRYMDGVVPLSEQE